MALFDLPQWELERYQPELDVPDDLDLFWSETLDQSRARTWDPVFTPVETGLALVQTFDVTFAGYGGQPIKGWLQLPADREDAALPIVVTGIGYGGGRGLPHEIGPFPLAGYAELVVDTRGQGSVTRRGDTPDPDGSGPAVPGFLTRGLEDPETYYYRRVFTDIVLAIDAARVAPFVDPERVAVSGRSQGGGMAIAAAALADGLVAVLADVPFLCDFPRSTRLVDTAPYLEIADYLRIHRGRVEQAYRTLSYFDGAVLAAKATAPALFSVALMDQVCPPSSVYAAYNAYRGDKQIRVYPFNGHEGGQAVHQVDQLVFLADRLR